jgi:uncharacterized membrane protein YfcA
MEAYVRTLQVLARIYLINLRSGLYSSISYVPVAWFVGSPCTLAGTSAAPSMASDLGGAIANLRENKNADRLQIVKH